MMSFTVTLKKKKNSFLDVLSYVKPRIKGIQSFLKRKKESQVKIQFILSTHNAD